MVREGMFVSDYVKTKYQTIYHEAAMLYNQINQSYPQKPDLRKTVEYRRWKNRIAAANNQPTTPIPRQRNQVRVHMLHPNIAIGTTTAENTVHMLHPNIPSETTTAENTVPQGPPPPTENQATDKRIAGKQMQLTIPLMQFSPFPKTIQPSASPGAVMEEDDQGILASASQEITVEEGDQGILAAASQEITTEEGDQPEVIDPSLFDQISPEIMDRLISELQRDPNLKSIMDDVQNSVEEEANIEEELIGLTIDLPELEDPLEEESIFW